MPTGLQIRAARGLVDWSADDLVKRSGVNKQTILRFERGELVVRDETMSHIVRVFDAAGIDFLENHGVRIRPKGTHVYEGAERFDDFYNFLYEHTKVRGGDICLSVADENLLVKYRKDSSLHYKRMTDLFEKKIIKSFRILANKSDFIPEPYNTYKWQPEASVAPTAFYTFGDCLALISFDSQPAPYVAVIESAAIAASYRQAFDIAWEAASQPPVQKKQKR